MSNIGHIFSGTHLTSILHQHRIPSHHINYHGIPQLAHTIGVLGFCCCGPKSPKPQGRPTNSESSFHASCIGNPCKRHEGPGFEYDSPETNRGLFLDHERDYHDAYPSSRVRTYNPDLTYLIVIMTDCCWVALGMSRARREEMKTCSMGEAARNPEEECLGLLSDYIEQWGLNMGWRVYFRYGADTSAQNLAHAALHAPTRDLFHGW